MIGIYKFTNKINNKGYIGKSIHIEDRYKEHIKSKDDLYFHRALIKYGIENFDFRVLIECPVDDLNFWEKFFIKMYDTTNSEYGYNLTFGGDGVIPTEEVRKKISEGHKGIHHTEEARKKISEAKKNKPTSEEFRKKMSEVRKGKPGWNKGKKLSEEARKKMSEAHKGKPSFFKGKHHSEEVRKKISEAKKGQHYIKKQDKKKDI